MLNGAERGRQARTWQRETEKSSFAWSAGGLTFSSGGVSCRSCSTLHHRVCWEYTGACSVYACDESRFLVGDMDQLSGEFSTLPAVSQADADLVVDGSSAGNAPAPLESHDCQVMEAEYPPVTGGTQYCPECHSVNPGFVESCAY